MKKQVHHYLELSRLEPDLQLARQLPPDLARRYHALPVAKDGERITVAMADPNDAIARDAVMTTFGKSTCIVQADLNTIDGLLEELWPDNLNHPLNFLAWAPPDSIGDEVRTYAQNLSTMLGARLNSFETPETGKGACRALIEETERARADMVIFRAPRQSMLSRLVDGGDDRALIDLLPVSSLLVFGIRWPIKNILFVLRNEDSDEVSLDWTLDLAKPCGALVTVLPMTIPVPAVYAHLQPEFPTLLATDCRLGRKMRWVASRLVDRGIEGTLRLRNEPPNDQIRCEVLEGDYDLIVIAAEPQNRFRRQFYGDLVTPLAAWADRPLLIAKPRINQKEKK